MRLFNDAFIHEYHRLYLGLMDYFCLSVRECGECLRNLSSIAIPEYSRTNINIIYKTSISTLN